MDRMTFAQVMLLYEKVRKYPETLEMLERYSSSFPLVLIDCAVVEITFREQLVRTGGQ